LAAGIGFTTRNGLATRIRFATDNIRIRYLTVAIAGIATAAITVGKLGFNIGSSAFYGNLTTLVGIGANILVDLSSTLGPLLNIYTVRKVEIKTY